MAITIAGEVQDLSRRHSERTRRKIAASMRRYWRLLPEDERAARSAMLSMALRGREFSDMHRQRLSAAKFKYWADIRRASSEQNSQQ
jgi:hypothetical protein